MFDYVDIPSVFVGMAAVALVIIPLHFVVLSRRSHRRLKIVKDERARLTQELHDGFLQDVIAAQMTLRQKQRSTVGPQSDPDLAQASSLLANAVQLARASLRDLKRSSPAKGEGVEDFLAQSSVVKVCSRMDIRVQETGARWHMSLARQEKVYWVIREAVVNACKHSGADQVDVQLNWSWSGLEVAISDQGQGFAVTPGQDLGNGLSQMKRNAMQAGGQVYLYSQPGHGTCLRMNVPRVAIGRPGA